MERSESIAKVAAALVAAQTEIKNMAPNKEGYGYKYVDFAEIIDATKPVLQKHKLVITQFPVGDVGNVGVKTILAHESGEFIANDFVMPLPQLAKMNPAQAAGAVITYARRYAVSAVLGIASDEDVDAAPESTQKRQEPSKIDPTKVRDSMVMKLKEAADRGLYTQEEFEQSFDFIATLKGADEIMKASKRLDDAIKQRTASK